MAYGLRVNDSAGNKLISTEDVGLQIVGEVEVLPDGSGSQTFEELNYHSTLYIDGFPEATGALDIQKINGFESLDITVTIRASTTLDTSYSSGTTQSIGLTSTIGFVAPGVLYIDNGASEPTLFNFTQVNAGISLSSPGVNQRIPSLNSGSFATDNVPVVSWSRRDTDTLGARSSGSNTRGGFPTTRLIIMAN